MKKVFLLVLLLSCFSVACYANAYNYNDNDNQGGDDLYRHAYIKDQNPTVIYKVHARDNGWMVTVSNGKMAGTTGQGRQLEAIRIALKDSSNLSVQYRVHIEDNGWKSSCRDGKIAGTIGENKRMEAIRIQLLDSSQWSVVYKVHIAGRGWSEWKRDGEIAGTTGEARAIEAIKIRIVKKGEYRKNEYAEWDRDGQDSSLENKETNWKDEDFEDNW